MPVFTPQQVTEALRRAGFNRTATRSDIAAAQRFGLGAFARTRAQMTRRPPPAVSAVTTPEPAEPTADDVTRSFIDHLRPLFTPAARPEIKPFEQSGFYSEPDARELSSREYDPHYARLGQEQEGLNREEDRRRLEEVNAAGGYRSSAYEREQELRRQAVARAQEERDAQKRLAKEQFVQSRRGEAYQRYLQSIGAITA